MENEIINNIRNFYNDDLFKKCAFAGGAIIKGESDRVTPFDKGNLLDSSRLSYEKLGGLHSYAISYNTTYAVKVHEGVDLNFQNNKEPKFLENALNDSKVQSEVLMQVASMLGFKG
ncbi:MAG: hypothetical protein ACK5LV_04350 [Lachnospirales bacterium]